MAQRSIIGIVSGFGIIVVAGSAWWYFSGHRMQQTAVADAAAQTASVASAMDTASSTFSDAARPVPADCGQTPGAACVEYRNEQYHFSVFYSDHKTVLTYDEGGGAATIVFQNTADVHGFQVFVVPYAGTQVTPERFKKDEPSGVRTDLTTVTVDGATGAAFYSYDQSLGDTYEVWFIHGGYLYELTTLKARAANMQERLQTWKFI